MKIAAFADTHLPGAVDWRTGAMMEWRREDFVAAFRIIIEEILDWGPDLTLFAGDAFQFRGPSPRWVVEFASGLFSLAQASPLVLVPGNHDMARDGSILEILEIAGMAGVHYIGKPSAIEVSGAQVFGMPAAMKGWVFAARKKYTAIGDIEREVERLVQTGIRAFLAQPFDGPRIFVGHLTMLGGTFGGFRPATLGHEVFWQSSWLDGFDAVALGHLHRHQFPDPSRPQIAYCGSTERLDFGERDEDKGWMSIDLSDEKPGWEFHKIYSRPMVQIELQSTQEPFPDVHPESIVKTIIHLEAGQHAPEIVVDCKYLLPPTYLWAGGEQRRPRLAGEIADKTPEELLMLYWEYKKVPPERMEVLMQYAKGVMADAIA